MILTYVVVFSGLSFLTNLNVPMVTNTIAGGRVSPTGMNANQISFLYALIVVGIVSWLLATWPNVQPRHYPLMMAGLSLMVAHVRTGSRGGSFALVAGLVFTSILHFRMRRLPTYLLVLPPIIAGVLQIMTSSPILAPRMQATIEERDTGTRFELAQGGLLLFSEEPFKGHGPAYVGKLGEMIGVKRISVHNTYLQILVSFGILGTIPYFAGLFATLRSVWRSRQTIWGATMLSALGMLLTFGMGGHMGYNRHYWILLALVGNAGSLGASVKTLVRRTAPPAGGWLRPGTPTVMQRPRKAPARRITPGLLPPPRGARGRTPTGRARSA
jgi:O-antigen ligase